MYRVDADPDELARLPQCGVQSLIDKTAMWTPCPSVAEAKIPGAALKRDKPWNTKSGNRRCLYLFVLVDTSEARSVPSSKAA
jgi:hypothetical protein